MKIHAAMAPLLALLLGACAASRGVGPSTAAVVLPASAAAGMNTDAKSDASAAPTASVVLPPASMMKATLASASAWLVANAREFGEVDATFLYDDKRGPFGRGLRAHTVLELRFDGCRMTLSQTETTWRIDRPEPEATERRHSVVIDMLDVDARSIKAVKLGGLARVDGYAVNHKYRGSTVELRLGAVGGANRFRVSDTAEPLAARTSFMLSDSEIGAQAAKALMRVAELCRPERAASARPS